jgi:hypothetical protein
MHLVWLKEHPKLTNVAVTLAIRGFFERKREGFWFIIEEFETKAEAKREDNKRKHL